MRVITWIRVWMMVEVRVGVRFWVNIRVYGGLEPTKMKRNSHLGFGLGLGLGLVLMEQSMITALSARVVKQRLLCIFKDLLWFLKW
jgi:hypothetical protein